LTWFEEAMVRESAVHPPVLNAALLERRMRERLQRFYEVLLPPYAFQPFPMALLADALRDLPAAGAPPKTVAPERTRWVLTLALGAVECVESTHPGSGAEDDLHIVGDYDYLDEPGSCNYWRGHLWEGQRVELETPFKLAEIRLGDRDGGLHAMLGCTAEDVLPVRDLCRLNSLEAGLNAILRGLAREACDRAAGRPVALPDTFGRLSLGSAWQEASGSGVFLSGLALDIGVTWDGAVPRWRVSLDDPAWSLLGHARRRELPEMTGVRTVVLDVPIGRFTPSDCGLTRSKGLFSVELRVQVAPGTFQVEPERAVHREHVAVPAAAPVPAPAPVASKEEEEDPVLAQMTPRAPAPPPVAAPPPLAPAPPLPAPATTGHFADIDDGPVAGNAPASQGAQPPPRPSFAPGTEAPITLAAVPVRSKPDPHGLAVAHLGQGDRVRVQEETEGWFRVRTAEGVEGWIHESGLLTDDYWESLTRWSLGG